MFLSMDYFYAFLIKQQRAVQFEICLIKQNGQNASVFLNE